MCGSMKLMKLLFVFVEYNLYQYIEEKKRKKKAKVFAYKYKNV